jgi:hypothetical protein
VLIPVDLGDRAFSPVHPFHPFHPAQSLMSSLTLSQCCAGRVMPSAWAFLARHVFNQLFYAWGMDVRAAQGNRLLGIGMLPMILLGGLATFVMRSSAGGKGLHGVVQSGRDVIDRIGVAVGRATGKELSTAQTALLLAGVAYLMYQYNPLGSAPASSGEPGSTGALSAPSVQAPTALIAALIDQPPESRALHSLRGLFQGLQRRIEKSCFRSYLGCARSERLELGLGIWAW